MSPATSSSPCTRTSPACSLWAARAGGALDVVADDPPPSWAALLDAARQMAPDGAWPLGPHRFAPGFRVHVVQARGHGLTPGARWSDEPDPSWPEPLRDAVRAVLDDDAGRAGAPSSRAPWLRRGWWDEATAWVDAVLAEAGRRRTDDLQPQEHWGISAVARVPATGGTLWLKAVPSIFRREPAVLTVLAERLPGRVPGVFATDEGSDDLRFLLHDAGPVPDEGDAGDPPRLAALLADLQVRTTDLLPRLVSAGAADRSPARLAFELARVADDGFELDLLEPAERARLRKAGPAPDRPAACAGRRTAARGAGARRLPPMERGPATWLVVGGCRRHRLDRRGRRPGGGRPRLVAASISDCR